MEKLNILEKTYSVIEVFQSELRKTQLNQVIFTF